jgi:hypothetical protein
MTLFANGSPTIPIFSDGRFTAVFVLIGILAGLKIVVDKWAFDKGREKRRSYYRDTSSVQMIGSASGH